MIRSKDSHKIKEARELLKKRQAAPVEGKKLVLEILQTELKPLALFLREEDSEIESLAQKKGINPLFVTEKLLKSLSELKTPPGQLLLVKPPSWMERNWKRVVILERVQDPTNVGSIIRTAYCLGYDAIYSDLETAYPYTGKVIRTSSGYALRIPFLRIKDLRQKIRLLAKQLEIIGTFPENGEPLEGFRTGKNFAVVFGNESQGISSELNSLIKRRISIPMKRGESLSVSASAAIILYFLSKSQSFP